MKLGLQIPSFTWPGGPDQIGPTLGRIARTADDAGYDSIWVMDHFFQIGGVGPVEEPMLEGYSALSFLAGHTSRAKLGTLVTGVTYLRLVARYADACNVFGDAATARHKFEVLRRHCEAEGRDYDRIEKTVYFSMDVGPDGEGSQQVVDQLGVLSEAGVQAAIGALRGVRHTTPIEIVGRDVIPQVARL